MKDRMKSLFLVLAMASVLCFGTAGVVYADPFPIEPYISITIPAKLDLGSIVHPGSHIFTPTLTMYIAANVPYHIDINIETSLNDIAGTYTGTLNAYGNTEALIGRIPRWSCCVNKITRNQLN